MPYNGGIARHAANVSTRYRRVFVGVCTEVDRSVRLGSEITGAPGQPVDTGTLVQSWIPRFLAQWIWQIATNVEYAPIVEHNPRGVTFRNHGPHSVAVTMQNADLILEHVVRQQRTAA